MVLGLALGRRLLRVRELVRVKGVKLWAKVVRQEVGMGAGWVRVLDLVEEERGKR